LSNNFEIKSNDELRKVILEKAIKAGQSNSAREDWLGNTWGRTNRNDVGFSLEEFFVVPQEYLEIKQKRKEEIEIIYSQIASLEAQLNTIEIRIMVASDKALQKLINEIDDMGDMGDISLIDTKIKLLD
jgi:rRNA maturation endonuclease Nob1